MSNEREPVYETENYVAEVIQYVEEPGLPEVEGYGITNKTTGVREMEVRREDVVIQVIQMLERLRKNLHKPMSDDALATLQPVNEVAA